MDKPSFGKASNALPIAFSSVVLLELVTCAAGNMTPAMHTVCRALNHSWVRFIFVVLLGVNALWLNLLRSRYDEQTHFLSGLPADKVRALNWTIGVLFVATLVETILCRACDDSYSFSSKCHDWCSGFNEGVSGLLFRLGCAIAASIIIWLSAERIKIDDRFEYRNLEE